VIGKVGCEAVIAGLHVQRPGDLVTFSLTHAVIVSMRVAFHAGFCDNCGRSGSKELLETCLQSSAHLGEDEPYVALGGQPMDDDEEDGEEEDDDGGAGFLKNEGQAGGLPFG